MKLLLMPLIVYRVTPVTGHAALTHPSPRTKMEQIYAGQCVGAKFPKGQPSANSTLGPGGGTCDWYYQGCQPGCDHCVNDCSHLAAALGRCCEAKWTPTMEDDSPLRTYIDAVPHIDVGFRYNPWRSPGFAPVMGACGVAAGGEPGTAITGVTKGIHGESLPEFQSGATWVAGATAGEVQL